MLIQTWTIENLPLERRLTRVKSEDWAYQGSGKQVTFPGPDRTQAEGEDGYQSCRSCS